jgi:hypothetical protein
MSKDGDQDSYMSGWDPRAGPNPSLSNRAGLVGKLRKTPNSVGVFEGEWCGGWRKENWRGGETSEKQLGGDVLEEGEVHTGSGTVSKGKTLLLRSYLTSPRRATIVEFSSCQAKNRGISPSHARLSIVPLFPSLLPVF